ncbi:MAG TPA: thioredoxin fold domain-containing protein [Burkholderiales bacterium]|nr:thioredoxin fold domain-containing protein [Burkholderiales bacterium]
MRIPLRLLLAIALALACTAPRAQEREVPGWFAESFLEFPQDVKEAARDGKRLMLYFWQDGCPFCQRMKETTLADPGIVAATRASFVAVALNTFGERELQWTDGRTMREKELARELGIRGTPTLVFLDERGAIILRRVGYVPGDSFRELLAKAAPPR